MIGSFARYTASSGDAGGLEESGRTTTGAAISLAGARRTIGHIDQGAGYVAGRLNRWQRIPRQQAQKRPLSGGGIPIGPEYGGGLRGQKARDSVVMQAVATIRAVY
jgi:hypothetical protein